MERVAQFTEAMEPYPGKLITTGLGGEQSAHVVDRAFLAFWIRHRDFHFVN